MVLFAVYMIFSVDSVIWNCICYLLIFSFIELLLIELFKQKEISKHLVWSALVFNTEVLFIFLSLLNKDKITYNGIITSVNTVILLVGSIIITLICVTIFESIKWKRGNG